MTHYSDHTWPELGVTYQWNNATIIDSIQTKRNTHVEMVERPNWGIACYMNNAIQSCELDEALYHEALVHPAMACMYQPKRIMIVGGGEGATAREVLKWPTVEKVDMYEWDQEVIQLFQTKYPQWAKGAWEDPRLTIHTNDIIEAIQTPPVKRYDVIIIDLFDPSEEDRAAWTTIFQHLPNWTQIGGSIVLYTGMRCMTQSIQPYEFLLQLINESPIHKKGKECMHHYNHTINREVVPYRVYIPSFLGESTFLLLKSRASPLFYQKMKEVSKVTKDIWQSYRTFNY
jgi:predicted membrane-bound spermidine synthase